MRQEPNLSALARPPVEWPLKVSYTASVFSMLIGIVVLAGWWFGFMTLVRPIPGSPAMVPDTALCFMLLGTSLFLFVRPNLHFGWRMLAQALVVVAMVLSAITLAEFATGRELGVDHLFVGNSPETAAGFGLKRSGPGSAAAFALISLALLTLDSKRAVRNHFSEALAIGAWLVALISAAGYAYGVTALYEVAAVPDTGMAPHTVAMVLVLSAGVICARPARPLMSLVTSPRIGGFVIRRLLLGTSTIPLLGLLIMLGLRGSLYDEPFANALLAVAAMAIAVGLVLSVGRKLDRMDVARTASEQAVVEREERLRDLIQQASDGVFIADLDGRYQEVNDAVCRMLGMPREEIVGKSIMDFIPWSDHPRFEASRAGLLRGGSQMDEWTLVRRDETRLPVEVSTKILRDGRWQGLIRDISTRKQVERATDAMAEAVTGSPESSLQTVLQTIALEAKLVANAQYAAFGLGGDHVHPFESWVFVGLTPEQAAKLGRPPRPIGLLGLVAERDQPVRVADIQRHPTFRGFPRGHPPMTSFLGVPIRRHGRSVGSLYLANKIGAGEFTVEDERAVERIAARAGTVVETARLYQTEGLERAWLESVIDQMPEGVVLSDATGATRVENQSMRTFSFDTGQSDPLGQGLRYDVRLPNGQPLAPAEQPQFRALVGGATTIGQELSLRHPNGRLIPMLVSAAPVSDAQGNRSGAVTIYQDISTLKELERLREEWSSIVAHDLRQPVGLIALEADVLARMIDHGEMAESPKLIAHIRRSTTRLNQMIDDLQDVSRIETNRLELKRTETDLAALLDDVVDRLALLAPGHPVVFQSRVRPAPVVVDPTRLEQVLANLISNAAKYGRPEDEISIDLQRYGSDYKISVANRGGGISSSDMPKLFERFWRSEATRGSAIGGLGVGLYICKGLVEAQGGRIWAESTSGETTTFHFTIPIRSGSTLAAA